MKPRVLITGMEGFAGSHLAELALSRGCEVHGACRPGASGHNLRGLSAARVHDLEITDGDACRKLVRQVRPQRIFHLAGKSNPTLSRQDPEGTLRVNVLGTLQVLEAAKQLSEPPRILIAGSADEYGPAEAKSRRITEAHALHPEGPYAVSKVCQDLAGLAYFQQLRLPVIRVRPFNHIGPRQALGFVATDFASQIISIELGRRVPVMEVGNLDVTRDFSDVRDIAAGYWALSEKGRPGEAYNLGSGRGVTVRRLLDLMLACTTARIEVRVKSHKTRREKRCSIASIAKIRKHTGWRSLIPLEETVRAILADWRERLG